MEGGSDWTASNLFSPSKARIQQAQAKDWALVDEWLTKKNGYNAPPSFERNEETLQALLHLANLNETADEQQDLIERVEKAAIQSLQERTSHRDETYQTVINHLTDEGHDSLDVLAETSFLVNAGNTPQTAENISGLTIQQFEAHEQLKRTEAQLETLKREQDRVSEILKKVKSKDFAAPSDLPEETVEWNRSAKHLKAKVGEYNERLSAFRAQPTPPVTAEDLSRRTKPLKSEKERLAELTGQLSSFENLPTQPNAARAQLEDARGELRNLMAQRDKLFEGLVDRG